MVVVVHKAIGMNEHIKLFVSIPDDFKEEISILWGKENDLLLVPAGIHMIISPWVFDTKLSGSGVRTIVNRGWRFGVFFLC